MGIHNIILWQEHTFNSHQHGFLIIYINNIYDSNSSQDIKRSKNDLFYVYHAKVTVIEGVSCFKSFQRV